MELALIILAVAVVLGAVILAFARPRAAAPAPDSRLDAVLSGQGDISGQFKAAIQARLNCSAPWMSVSRRWTNGWAKT